MELSDLFTLVNEYGFAILFSVLAMALIFWVVRKLVSHLISSSRQKDILITNHISHLTEHVLRSNEKIDNFDSNLNNGLDRIAQAFESGLDRQTQLLIQVLDKNDEHEKDG